MSEFIGHKQPKTDIGFGDMVKIEMYRYYSENEYFIHKVIGTFGSNAWIDTPLRWDSEITLHDHTEEVLNVVQCGLDETKVIRVAKKDVIKMDVKPSLNENQQIVLDWLNGDIQKRNPFASIKTLVCRADFDSDSLSDEVKKAYNKLDKNQEFHVLRTFGEWGLSHERN